MWRWYGCFFTSLPVRQRGGKVDGGGHCGRAPATVTHTAVAAAAATAIAAAVATAATAGDVPGLAAVQVAAAVPFRDRHGEGWGRRTSPPRLKGPVQQWTAVPCRQRRFRQ